MSIARCGRAAAVLMLSILSTLSVVGYMGDAPSSAAGGSDPRAAERLSAASQRLGRAKSFECTLRSERRSAGGEPQRVEARLALLRPNRFKVVAREQGGDAQTLCSSATCDGSEIYIYTPGGEIARSTTAPDTLADLVGSGVIPLRANVAGAAFGLLLLAENLEAAIAAEASALEYVEREADGGLHHIRAVCPERTIDLWIADGDEALIRKVRVAPKEAGPARDVVEERYDDWGFDPGLTEAEFSRESVSRALARPAGGAAATGHPHPLVGKPAESVALEMLGGGTLDLTAHRGKDVVVLDFWATWCVPCIHGLPTVMESVRDKASKGVVLYAVNRGEAASVVQKFIQKRGWSELAVPLDQQNALGDRYNVRAIPQTVIIDKAGIITAVHVGIPKQLEALRERLDREIDEALAR